MKYMIIISALLFPFVLGAQSPEVAREAQPRLDLAGNPESDPRCEWSAVAQLWKAESQLSWRLLSRVCGVDQRGQMNATSAQEMGLQIEQAYNAGGDPTVPVTDTFYFGNPPRIWNALLAALQRAKFDGESALLPNIIARDAALFFAQQAREQRLLLDYKRRLEEVRGPTALHPDDQHLLHQINTVLIRVDAITRF